MSLTSIKKTIDRANELDMLSFACADTIDEAKAIAQLHPDIMNPEPTALIGSGSASDLSYVLETVKAIKAIYPDILVEQAAGITKAEQVYEFIMAGSDAAGSCSGIMNSKEPLALLEDMIHKKKKAKGALTAK
jgi:triosephosphate isomerase